MTMFTVVCFDVCDKKRLYRVSRELGNFGVRVQRSVFECHLTSKQLVDLQGRLAKHINEEEDHVRYYFLCPKDLKNVSIDGVGRVSCDPGFMLL